MIPIQKIASVGLLYMLFAGTATAACYEAKTVPSLDCGRSTSNSADFATSCSATTTVIVEVACPPPPPPPSKARWVNAKYARYFPVPLSQAETCAAYGMKPSNINGYVCASGNKRPNFGTGWESIDYRHTIRGDRRVGGTYVVPAFGNQYSDPSNGHPPYQMCYPDHHGKGDRTNIVDAYVCE